MIDIKSIKGYFPQFLNTQQKIPYMVKEYLQYNILDHLSKQGYANNLCFIGGTNLRLVHGINRFSEDLDFDIKHFSRSDFNHMTETVLQFLERTGINAVFNDKEKDLTLKAYRRTIVFPEFLYQNKLSGHKEEKFYMKIECQDQGIEYLPKNFMLKGCGTFCNFTVPPDPVLCSMKLSALLDRQKGRDFYDVMFLLTKTEPDFKFLEKRKGISNIAQLKDALLEVASKTDLKLKARDFEHLIFNKEDAGKILLFMDFIESKYPQIRVSKGKGKNE